LKLEEIQELWNRDRDIDISNLAVESVRIPQVHDKYLKIYIDERIKLKGLEFDLAKITRLKTNYYAGTMSQEELDELGWQPFLVKVIKGERQAYLDSDDDIIKLKKNMVIVQEKINYVDSIIKMISNRGFQIKSAIDWIKYKDGIT
tara:strand:- start:2296 stop:2733 length:438 start_codon:yes stop_codon:yes gene_type:complete